MKLYLYYLSSDNKVRKEIETGVRENKKQYVIPALGKSRLSCLYEWKLSKNCCDKIQVDYALCSMGPCIVSIRGDLDNIPQLSEMLLAVSKSCESVNNLITDEKSHESI